MKPRTRRILLVVLWIATIGFWLGIFVLTHVPMERLPRVKVSDRSAHFVAYAVLSGLLYVTSWVGRPDRRWLAVKVLAVALVYGAVDELLQPYVGRTADVVDWLYDAAGALCALTPLVLIRRLSNWRSRLPGGLEERMPPEYAGVSGEIRDTNANQA